MKIAIIGSGISGLVVAYKLHAKHDITLYEANDYVGGHTNTVEAEINGETQVVDTGFIVFNDWTYPNFIGLLKELGVESNPTLMSFSVRDDRSNLEYCGNTLDTLFAQRLNIVRPMFYRILRDLLRFNREARNLVGEGDHETTVGEFLVRHRFSQEFADYYLLPMGSAIWSCPTGTFAQFPIRFIVDFYKNHGLLSIHNKPTWHVIDGGSRSYVRAMTRNFRERIRLNTLIESVMRTDDHVLVKPLGSEAESFDHVIFACHSDQALRILGSEATPVERELLSAFPYERNTAVLHTDINLLPRRRKAWAAWNYRLTGNPDAPASVTYNMNILQHLKSKHTFCVTLNDDSIAPECVIKRFVYHHPVFTTQRAEAQARHGEVVNANRTSYCGAYWRNGFHEDGVVSALAVVGALEGGVEMREPTSSATGTETATQASLFAQVVE